MNYGNCLLKRVAKRLRLEFDEGSKSKCCLPEEMWVAVVTDGLQWWLWWWMGCVGVRCFFKTGNFLLGRFHTRIDEGEMYNVRVSQNFLLRYCNNSITVETFPAWQHFLIIFWYKTYKISPHYSNLYTSSVFKVFSGHDQIMNCENFLFYYCIITT